MGLREQLLGVAGLGKIPTLVIYWADTSALLTYEERKAVRSELIQIVDITPLEVLFYDPVSKRKIVVRGITDKNLPEHLHGIKLDR